MLETDDQLVERLKKGDEKAFYSIYERHSKSLLRHLLSMMNNAEEAEDILHESLMLMIKKINFYEPRAELESSFKTWLFRIATNRAIDEIRKRKKPMAKSNEVQASEDEKYQIQEEENSLKRYMDQLPPLQKTVLNLRVHEDLSYIEIATICGKDVNAIKQCLFQARKSLKTFLQEEGVIS
jgi:RNA polymerase sigma-70 factor (ECF subfamily)